MGRCGIRGGDTTPFLEGRRKPGAREEGPQKTRARRLPGRAPGGKCPPPVPAARHGGRAIQRFAAWAAPGRPSRALGAAIGLRLAAHHVSARAVGPVRAAPGPGRPSLGGPFPPVRLGLRSGLSPCGRPGPALAVPRVGGAPRPSGRRRSPLCPPLCPLWPLVQGGLRPRLRRLRPCARGPAGAGGRLPSRGPPWGPPLALPRPGLALLRLRRFGPPGRARLRRPSALGRPAPGGAAPAGPFSPSPPGRFC